MEKKFKNLNWPVMPHDKWASFGYIVTENNLAETVFVQFSQSFLDESQTRVGTAEYVIKQKPKPRPPKPPSPFSKFFQVV